MDTGIMSYFILVEYSYISNGREGGVGGLDGWDVGGFRESKRWSNIGQ